MFGKTFGMSENGCLCSIVPKKSPPKINTRGLCGLTQASYYSLDKAKCPMRHPPGNEIYRKQNISFFEIDGRKNKVGVYYFPESILIHIIVSVNVIVQQSNVTYFELPIQT